MIREFVSTTVFDRQWAELELTDEDRRELEKRGLNMMCKQIKAILKTAKSREK